MHPKPHIHVQNPLFGKLNTRLRMYKVLKNLLKFMFHLCKASMVGPLLLTLHLIDPCTVR